LEPTKQLIMKTLSLQLRLTDHDGFLFTIAEFMLDSPKRTE